MKRKLIIIISWLLVLGWMGVIFFLSDMSGTESTRRSEKTINSVIKKTLEATNEVGITKTNPDSKKVKKVSEELDYPMRKLMHASVYFILTLLLINAFYQSGVRGKKIFIYSIIFCFLYACSDEFHQSFTQRTPSFLDVIIDTCGGTIAIFLILIIKKIKLKQLKKEQDHF